MWVGGNRVSQAFDGVGFPAFSPDSQKVAYVALTGRKMRVVQGEARGPELDEVTGWITWSPDSRAHAYAGMQGGQHFVFEGERKFGPFVQAEAPRFDSEGKLVFMAQEGGSFRVYRDGKPVHDVQGTRVYGPFFGPKAGAIAWVADGGVFLNGKKVSGERLGVSRVAMAADGRVAYCGRTPDGTICVAVNDKVQTRLPEDVESAEAIWSPAGDRLAVVSYGMFKSRVRVGEWVSEAYDGPIFRCVFSPDGSKIAFGAMKGREAWWKVQTLK
jgi:hypothetical protein